MCREHKGDESAVQSAIQKWKERTISDSQRFVLHLWRISPRGGWRNANFVGKQSSSQQSPYTVDSSIDTSEVGR